MEEEKERRRKKGEERRKKKGRGRFSYKAMLLRYVELSLTSLIPRPQ